jgi:hypothetical protein
MTKHRLVVCLAATAAIAGCAAGPPADPAVLAADRDRSIAARESAIERLGEQLSDPKTREQLKTIAWSRREPFTLRQAAIEQLLANDPADTRTMLALLAPTEPSADVVALIADVATERRWADLTPPLVRAWTRPRPGMDTADRPEPRAIAALHPDRTVGETLFELFITPAPERPFNEKERRAAWEALGLVDPTGADAARRLAELPPTDDPLVSAVRDSAVDLGAVPVTQEQLEWLTLLRETEPMWSDASDAIGRLDESQRQRLAIRHAAPVAIAADRAPRLLTRSRDELISELRDRLAGRRSHARSAEGGARDPLAESIARAEPDLAWADALHVLLIDDALQDPHLAAQLFAHADRDHADTSTEYGGVLLAGESATPEALLYPPRPAQRQGDKRFIAAPEMFTQHPGALAHFHFHVQSKRNARYAGPGPGDRAYADAYGRANLVLTFVDEDTLAVDYYHPGGVTLDLGEIKRPASD